MTDHLNGYVYNALTEKKQINLCCFTQPDKASEWRNVVIIATKEVL